MASTLDCLIVGAGFSGIALAAELRKRNRSFLLVDRASGVGGTWQTNCYPGARCDTPTVDYAFHAYPEFDKTWEWSEDYATQPEILEYLQHFVSFQKIDQHLALGTTLQQIIWDAQRSCWHAKLSTHQTMECRFVALALGALSKPFIPEITGLKDYRGSLLHTSDWPESPPSFHGKQVAILGTGASGIQLVPEVAEQCERLFVLQRSPSLAIPTARNQTALNNRKRMRKHQRQLFRSILANSPFAASSPFHQEPGNLLTDRQLELRFDQLWENGDLFGMVGIASDLFTNEETNERVRSLCVNRIRSQIQAAQLRKLATDTDEHFGTKRICVERGYYTALQRDHVELVDTNDLEISLTIDSIQLTPNPACGSTPNPSGNRVFPVDYVIFATGFDPFTGPLFDVEIIGLNGIDLRSHWRSEFKTTLGILMHGFPSLFLLQAPGAPSVLTNMAQSGQYQAEWIAKGIDWAADRVRGSIHASVSEEQRWTRHAQELAQKTLFAGSESWYNRRTKGNAKGLLLPYVGGHSRYVRECELFSQRLDGTG